MKIKVLNANYRIGCGRGTNYLDNDSAVEKLNAIIDWEGSTFPPNLDVEPHEEEVRLSQEGETRGCTIAILEAQMQGMSEDEIDSILIPKLEDATGKKINKTSDKWYTMMAKVYPENREYLGIPPRLKPGNVFEFDGQLIAIDEDPKTKKTRLILYNSETGPFALERIWKENILVEYNLKFPEEESFFDLQVQNSDMISFNQVFFFNNGETKLDELFDEDDPDSNDALVNPWMKKKLDPIVWRHFLKSFPGFKQALQENIFQLTCCPNLEEITFYMDKKGTLIYEFGDLDEEEFNMIFTCFWQGLWDYLDSIPELKEVIPTLSECKKKEA